MNKTMTGFDIEHRTYSCFWYTGFTSDTRKKIISRTVEQIIDKMKGHWNFRYYIKDGDYTRLINHLHKNFTFSNLIETFNEFNAGDLFLSNIEYDIIQFMEQFDEDDFSTISKINEDIKSQIQRYENREELVTNSNSTIIIWGNGCGCWGIVHSMKDQIKKGNSIQLDASMVLVPYFPSKVKRYLCLLDDSPIYKYSFEAIYERREVPFLEGVLGWVLKTIETEEYKKMQEKYA